MSQRYSRTEKGKWPAGPKHLPRRSPVQIPEEDNSDLIEANRLTLIGRATNPYVQKASAIIDFLPQFWNLEGRVTGQDLGRETFLFRFKSEEDLHMVLRKGPYHFKQWMVILQKWEAIVSKDFSSTITFWVDIIGIPLHHCTDKTVSIIGKELGPLSGKIVEKARVRVDINGLKPLEMSLEICLPTGELTVVEFVYEKLEKHCFSCFSLSHEKKHCPFLSTTAARVDKPLGVNQLKTLTRIEDDKKRQGERKRPRSALDEEERYRPKDRGGRVSARDLREWVLKASPPHPRPADSRQSYQSRGTQDYPPPPNKYRVRSYQEDSGHRMFTPRASHSLDKGSFHSHHQSDHRASAKETHSPSKVGSALALQTGEQNSNGHLSTSVFSRLQNPLATPTPSPRPAREPEGVPTSPATNRSTDSSKERRSALERIERRPALERLEPPPLQDSAIPPRHIEGSLGLQEVEIQYLEENSPTVAYRNNHASPSSSVFHRLGTTVNEARVSPLLRIEAQVIQDVDTSTAKRKNPTKAKQVKKTTPKTVQAKPAPKRRTTKAAVRTRGTRSPLQGVNTRKINVVRTQSKSKKRLQVEATSSLQGLEDVPIHSSASKDIPYQAQESNIRGIVADFRSPRHPLP